MSRNLLRIAVLYSLLGIGLGIFMAASGNYAYRSVHTHINLAGWVSMAVMALAYHVLPSLGRSLLAKPHFWLHTVGMVPMIAGVFMIYSGMPLSGEPLATVGSILVALGFICFAINVWRNAQA